jgi:predicted phosphodiesterase
MKSKKCKRKDCVNDAFVRGLCHKHYREELAIEKYDSANILQSKRNIQKNKRLLEKENRILTDQNELLKQVIDVVDELRSNASPQKAGIFRRQKKTHRLREGCALAIGSDWHVAEKVDSSKVEYKNEYSLSIFDKRVSRFFNGFCDLIEMQKQTFLINDIVLILAGDIITGYIHEELMETSELSPIMASRYAQKSIVKGINTILDAHPDIAKLHVWCVHGNHGRTTKKLRIGTGAENSYEHLMYLTLSDLFEGNEQVEFAITDGETMRLPVYDFFIRIAHGYQVNYRDGVGGIFVPLNKKIKNWETYGKADITCIGHYHDYQSLEYAVVNGSLIGCNPFSLSKGYVYTPPRQAFFMVDKKRCKCMSTPIWVDEIISEGGKYG